MKGKEGLMTQEGSPTPVFESRIHLMSVAEVETTCIATMANRSYIYSIISSKEANQTSDTKRMKSLYMFVCACVQNQLFDAELHVSETENWIFKSVLL